MKGWKKENIKVSDKLEYLEILINDSKKCCRIQTNDKEGKEINKCSIFIDGKLFANINWKKTFWKSIMSLVVIYGVDRIIMTRKK